MASPGCNPLSLRPMNSSDGERGCLPRVHVAALPDPPNSWLAIGPPAPPCYAYDRVGLRPTVIRRTLGLARETDKACFYKDLRLILQASSQERAQEEKALLEKHWGKKCPKLVAFQEEHFDAVRLCSTCRRAIGRGCGRRTISNGTARS